MSQPSKNYYITLVISFEGNHSQIRWGFISNFDGSGPSLYSILANGLLMGLMCNYIHSQLSITADWVHKYRVFCGLGMAASRGCVAPPPPIVCLLPLNEKRLLPLPLEGKSIL